MFSLRRISRLLLIVGLVPAVLASGLPLRACPCVSGASEQPTCCCCRPGSPCRGKDGACLCKAAGRRCRGSSGKAVTPTAGKPAAAPALGCLCTSRPDPASPPPISWLAAVAHGLPAVGLEAVVPSVVTPPSAERFRSARLPAPDLPTTLCALVI